MEILDYLTVFALLLVGHFLADFPLQNDFLARAKNRNTSIGVDIWPYALTGHSIIHGGFVGVLTGSLMFGIFEAISHWIIDYLKCEGKMSFQTDQNLHILLKVLWVVMMAFGYTSFDQLSFF